jgi:hypothetical protein
MARTQTTGGKQGRKWTPPATEPGDKPFAEVNLDGGKDAITRSRNDDHEEELPGGEDDDGPDESPQEKRFLNRSASVNKRITRLQRTFSQQLADSEARSQRQIADLRRENASLKVNRGVTETDQAGHDAKIAQLTKDLEDAYEKGDSKKQAQVSAEIARLEGAFEAKKRAALLGTPEREERADRSEERERGEPDNKGNGPTREAQRWMRANDGWWEDSEFSIERAAAVVIDNELIADGSDPNDPEHYDELAERLLKKFPEMKAEIVMPGERKSRRNARDDADDDDDEGEERGTRNRRGNGRPPVPGFNERDGERGARQASRGRSITLSRQQRENMVTFGLDPDNDDHVKEYAKSAEETNRAYGREGRR